MSKKSFAVLGDPISHSLSPKIHAAAYEYLNLDYAYEAVQVSAGSLERFINESGAKYSGFSITMPLKFEAAAFATYAELLGTGVCNTLVRNETGFFGYNTDVYGIQMAVKSFIRNPVKSVAILGSGATARSAVVAALGVVGVTNITVFARDTEKAIALNELVSDDEVSFESRGLADFTGGFDLTINTLPAGTANSLSITPKQTGFLLSAGYSTVDSDFNNQFSSSHLIAGTEMLIWQAVQQVKLFVGQDIDASAIDEAALADVMRQVL
jgi:shikimate dehydrogenase